MPFTAGVVPDSADFRDRLLGVDALTRASILGQLSDREAAALLYDWGFWARPDQLPPPGEWTTWVLQAGRGAGKTRSGAEWLRSRKEQGFKYFGIICRTPADARDVVVKGESGILATAPPWDRPVYVESTRSVTWPNGAKAIICSDEVPDGLRGLQFDSLWVDEFAKFKHPQLTWDMAMFCLRLSHDPRAIVTTTPTASKPFVKLVNAPGTIVTRASLLDNKAHLAPQFVRQVLALYEGTRLGRQEILGEIVAQLDGALWRRDRIEELRVVEIPGGREFLRRVVVGVDPSVTAVDGSDECGIVTVGLGEDNHAYVLDDVSAVLAPDAWAARSVEQYHRWECDRIIAEVNNGGDMVGLTIKTVDPGAGYEAVRASRGKRTRAEPVAALYEQGRVHHVNNLQGLEDEMCLAGGSLVLTSIGEVPIEHVVHGDRVWTREGWKSVLWSGQTGVRACREITAGGRTLRATANHPVWVAGRGFVRCDEVAAGHRIHAWRGLRSGPVSNSAASGTISQTTAITRRAVLAGVASIIASCTSRIMGRFQPPGTCTTRTKTAATTPSTISRDSRRGSTRRDMGGLAPGLNQPSNGALGVALSGWLASHTGPSAPGVTPSSRLDVSAADFALVDVAAVSEATERVRVYNLTVDGAHEFYADGVLTHNCTWDPMSNDPRARRSPNRIDALVWAIWSLLVRTSDAFLLAMQQENDERAAAAAKAN